MHVEDADSLPRARGPGERREVGKPRVRPDCQDIKRGEQGEDTNDSTKRMARNTHRRGQGDARCFGPGRDFRRQRGPLQCGTQWN
jgi:hypothetical protein